MSKTPVWQAGTAMSARALFTQLLRRQTWAELLYALLGLPIGIAGFVFTVTTISVSGGLIVTFVGLPLLAATGLASRYLGSGLRKLSNSLVGTAVAPPQRFRAGPGMFGWLASCLMDGTAWRARLYLLLRLPVGIAGFVIAVAFYSYGLGGVTYPIWRPFTPCQTVPGDSTCHRGASWGTSYFLDTPFRIAFTCVLGLVALLLAPWAVRRVLQLDRLLVRALLGPVGGAARVAELEHSRAVAVDDSAATLRRIERDLHDGARRGSSRSR